MRINLLPVSVGLLFVVVFSCRSPKVGGEGTSGLFRLEKETYCVGEPVVVEFTVTNAGSSVFSFFEGGDYRGGLRDEQFSLRVEDTAGRVHTTGRKGTFGGVGTLITLEPGQSFRSWQLLNPWFHLLPPGEYTVHCERMLSEDPDAEPPGAGSVEVTQDLSFKIKDYSKREILEQVAAMQAIEVSKLGVEHFFGVPVHWAIADLGQKFSIDVPSSATSSKVRELVLNALPDTWDDRYYITYDLTANRNWLTPGNPEEFQLRLLAKNHGAVPLPHRLAQSTLSLNGVVLSQWTEMVGEAWGERQLPESLPAGAAVEITRTLNEFLPPAKDVEVEWTLDGISRRVDVRIGR